MGFVTRFFVKPAKPALVQLPTGSFTVDREGKIMTSTLPRNFPPDHVQTIATHVLNAFRSARRAQLPLSEILVHYSALKLLARELRGGAIVFLMPQTMMSRGAGTPTVKPIVSP